MVLIESFRDSILCPSTHSLRLFAQDIRLQEWSKPEAKPRVQTMSEVLNLRRTKSNGGDEGYHTPVWQMS